MIRIAPLTGAELTASLAAVARLRIEVFRDFPYLYDGDLAYERSYLATLSDSPDAIVVGAWSGQQLVGAATGAPLSQHDAAFATALHGQDLDIGQIFYCAESVLLPAFRGQGIGHRFFDLREDHARTLGARHSAFAAVIRPADHPARPNDYSPLDRFWRARGYRPLNGATADYAWRDLGAPAETVKPMQIWIRAL